MPIIKNKKNNKFYITAIIFFVIAIPAYAGVITFHNNTTVPMNIDIQNKCETKGIFKIKKLSPTAVYNYTLASNCTAEPLLYINGYKVQANIDKFSSDINYVVDITMDKKGVYSASVTKVVQGTTKITFYNNTNTPVSIWIQNFCQKPFNIQDLSPAASYNIFSNCWVYGSMRIAEKKELLTLTNKTIVQSNIETFQTGKKYIVSITSSKKDKYAASAITEKAQARITEASFHIDDLGSINLGTIKFPEGAIYELKGTGVYIRYSKSGSSLEGKIANLPIFKNLMKTNLLEFAPTDQLFPSAQLKYEITPLTKTVTFDTMDKTGYGYSSILNIPKFVKLLEKNLNALQINYDKHQYIFINDNPITVTLNLSISTGEVLIDSVNIGYFSKNQLTNKTYSNKNLLDQEILLEYPIYPNTTSTN